MYGSRRSLLLEAILFPLSLLYGVAIRLRGLLYSLRVLRRRALSRPVISVGNITLGGTGKTPAAIMIAGMLSRSGRFPAVVSRGYGRRNEASIMVVSDGKSVIADTSVSGDEPALIGSKLPGVPVVVGKDRYRAALYAHQVFGPDTVVLDDGFQHLGLRRVLDVVLVDASDPFGNGKLFPAGTLREPLSSLRRADAVVITRSESAPDLEALRVVIRRHTQAPIFTSIYRPVDLQDVNAQDERPLGALRDLPVLMFSGIARPHRFRKLLEMLGAKVKKEIIYPDHYRYTRQDLAEIVQYASDAGVLMMVTTEKDAVKLKPFHMDGIWALRIEMQVQEREEWEHLVLRQSA